MKAPRPASLCASSTCQIILDGCRVPAFNVIGGKGNGFRVAVETLNTGRTSLGAGSVGGCKQMIKLAVEHATRDAELCALEVRVTGEQGVVEVKECEIHSAI